MATSLQQPMLLSPSILGYGLYVYQVQLREGQNKETNEPNFLLLVLNFDFIKLTLYWNWFLNNIPRF